MLSTCMQHVLISFQLLLLLPYMRLISLLLFILMISSPLEGKTTIFFEASSSTPITQKVEIQPGRTIHCQRRPIRLDAEHPTQRGIQILFVHGSCAASSQYDDLVNEMEHMIQQTCSTDDAPSGSGTSSSTVNPLAPLTSYSYDQLGCGKSTHPVDDWSAFPFPPQN